MHRKKKWHRFTGCGPSCRPSAVRKAAAAAAMPPDPAAHLLLHHPCFCRHCRCCFRSRSRSRSRCRCYEWRAEPGLQTLGTAVGVQPGGGKHPQMRAAGQQACRPPGAALVLCLRSNAWQLSLAASGPLVSSARAASSRSGRATPAWLTARECQWHCARSSAAESLGRLPW